DAHVVGGHDHPVQVSGLQGFFVDPLDHGPAADHRKRFPRKSFRPEPGGNDPDDSHYSKFKASFNSVGVTVAVPSFPTTIPAARLASVAASIRPEPQATAKLNTLITVSPAPVTSYTSRAFAGICVILFFSNSVMPSSPC